MLAGSARGGFQHRRFDIQPVLPMPISEKWNLISRFILPILAQPALVPGGDASFGTSDITLSLPGLGQVVAGPR